MEAGTQFVGFSDSVNINDRKSAVLNAQTVPMRMSGMLSGMGLAGWFPISITTDGPINMPMSFGYSAVPQINGQDNYSSELVEGSNTFSYQSRVDFSFYNDVTDYIDATEITINNFVNAGTINMATFNTIYNNLSKVYFPHLETCYNGIEIQSNSLYEVHLPLLTEIGNFFDSSVYIETNGNLNTVNIPNYKKGSLYINGSNLNELNLPFLADVYDLDLSYDTNLTSMNIGVVNLYRIIRVTSYTQLKKIELDKLEKIFILGGINIVSNDSIESFSISNIVEMNMNCYLGCNPLEFSFCPLLTDIKLGTIGILKKVVQPIVRINYCPLSLQSMENMLALFVSLDGTNGTTLSNGTIEFGVDTPIPNSICLAYISTLISRGWNITYND